MADIIPLQTHPKFTMVSPMGYYNTYPKHYHRKQIQRVRRKLFKNKRKISLKTRYGVYKGKPQFYYEVRKQMMNMDLRWQDLSIYCGKSIGTVRDACVSRTPNLPVKLRVARLLKIPKDKLLK